MQNLKPEAIRAREIHGIPPEKEFESMVFKTKFGGRGITKNGLTPELLVKAQKNRAARV